VTFLVVIQIVTEAGHMKMKLNEPCEEAPEGFPAAVTESVDR
jgi:hypothetical protein